MKITIYAVSSKKLWVHSRSQSSVGSAPSVTVVINFEVWAAWHIRLGVPLTTPKPKKRKTQVAVMNLARWYHNWSIYIANLRWQRTIVREAKLIDPLVKLNCKEVSERQWQSEHILVGNFCENLDPGRNGLLHGPNCYHVVTSSLQRVAKEL